MKIISSLSLLTLFLISLTGCDQNLFGGQRQTPKEMAANMVTEPVTKINPSKLCPIYIYDSNYTDLQRETVESEITGKIVQWKLQVYEVSSTSHQDVFRIQTRECTPESASPLLNQLEKDIEVAVNEK
jgi:hypothetical protein